MHSPRAALRFSVVTRATLPPVLISYTPPAIRASLLLMPTVSLCQLGYRVLGGRWWHVLSLLHFVRVCDHLVCVLRSQKASTCRAISVLEMTQRRFLKFPSSRLLPLWSCVRGTE